MLDFSKIIFNGYKCFKDETLLDDIKPINIIIGKNNIGKSSILDIIEMINDEKLLSLQNHVGIVLDKVISENEISYICSKGMSGGVFKTVYKDKYSSLDNYQIG